MIDLHEALHREAERLSPTADLDDVLARAARQVRQRRRTRRGLVALGVVAVVALVAVAVVARREAPTGRVVAGPPSTADPGAATAPPPGIAIKGGDPHHGTLERRDPAAATGPESVVVRADDGSLAHHSAVVTYPVDEPQPGDSTSTGSAPASPDTASTETFAVGDGWARITTDLGGDVLAALRRATHVDTTGHVTLDDPPAGLRVVVQGPAGTAVQREARYGSKALGEAAALGDGLTLAASATGGAIEDDLLARAAATDVFVGGQRAALYSPTFVGTSPPLLLGGNATLVWETSPGVMVSVGYSGSLESDASVAALTRLADRLQVVDEAAWAATNPQIIMAGGAVSPIPRPGPTPVTAADAAKLAAAVVGKTEDEARAVVAPYGWTVRVIEIDGVGQSVTKDLRADRIDVALRDGRVLGSIRIG